MEDKLKIEKQKINKEKIFFYLFYVSQVLGFIALLMSIDMYRQYASVSFFSHFLSVFYILLFGEYLYIWNKTSIQKGILLNTLLIFDVILLNSLL